MRNSWTSGLLDFKCVSGDEVVTCDIEMVVYMYRTTQIDITSIYVNIVFHRRVPRQHKSLVIMQTIAKNIRVETNLLCPSQLKYKANTTVIVFADHHITTRNMLVDEMKQYRKWVCHT